MYKANCTEVNADTYRPRSVLVVDDELQVRQLLARMIERLGMQALVAADGLAAIELLSADPLAVDMVILDLSMPGLDGAATMRALQAMRSDLRIVLSSGHGEEDSLNRCAGQFPNGFLAKPYRLDDVRRMLDHVSIS
jgi:two-component system, cell cycle sensor histidine kinase and response regulator CckA